MADGTPAFCSTNKNLSLTKNLVKKVTTYLLRLLKSSKMVRVGKQKKNRQNLLFVVKGTHSKSLSALFQDTLRMKLKPMVLIEFAIFAIAS